MNIGYACINTQLGKKKVLGGRTCRKATFQQNGLPYVGELALQNLRDIYTICQWNVVNNIHFYRMPSDIFPWQSEYELEQLPQYKTILQVCESIGKFATANNLRLTFHPGPFNILASNKPEVVKRTMKELRQHSQLFDMMGFEPSHYNKINIHIGAAYKDKYAVLTKWCENYKLLDSHTKKRLTIENDDKKSLYTISDLHTYVYSEVGIPLVMDFHHHNCHSGDMSAMDSFRLARNTWGDVRPVVHFSSSRRIYEDAGTKEQAHADYIYDEVPDEVLETADVMFEAKAKEKAVLSYKEKFSILV
jgi:UV DNA damage endonuclease